MSGDMHTIRFLLESAKEMAARSDFSGAKAKIQEMHLVYQDADIDGISGEISRGFIAEGEELLFDIREKERPTTVVKSSIWSKLFGKR